MLFQLQHDKKNKKEIKCDLIVKASNSNKAHKKDFYFFVLNGSVPLCVFKSISLQGSLILRNNLSKYFSEVGR